jgi:hypothetical protein
VTYDPDRPGALLEALGAARRRDLASARSLAIRRMRELDWDGIARLTHEAYR